METRNIIKSARQRKKLTMKEVAEYVGVSEATVSRWESGEISSIKHTQIKKLADCLGLSPSAFFDNDLLGPAPALSSAEIKLLEEFRKLSEERKSRIFEAIKKERSDQFVDSMVKNRFKLVDKNGKVIDFNDLAKHVAEQIKIDFPFK